MTSPNPTDIESATHRNSRRLLSFRARWGCALLLLGAVGCSQAPIPDYAIGEKTKALPELHQRQIREALTLFFGTPTQPRHRVLAEGDQGAPPEEAAGTTPAKSDGAPATPKAGSTLQFTDFKNIDHLKMGARVYRERCAGCHGNSGDGAGVAAQYLTPRPRDYRNGIYKFTSTPYGMKPARADLVRTIRRGAKGTSMPSFAFMADEELEAVIDYVILLSQRGEVELLITSLAETDYEADVSIEDADFAEALSQVQESWGSAEGAVVRPVSAEPAYDEASIELGRQAFMSRGCSKCHGDDGKGQTEWLSPKFLAAQAALPEGQRIQINYDAWGQPAPAADLTARMLHGGRRPLDIYRRIHTGINGTPMPAFGDALKDEPDTIWHLVHYVMGIVEGRVTSSSQATPGAPATAPAAAATSSTSPGRETRS